MQKALHDPPCEPSRAAGVLSALCAACLLWLAPTLPASAREIHGELARLAREPVTTGNEVEVLVSGPEFYPRRLELIGAAESTVDLSMFLWCPDESGRAVAEMLAAAARRGVRVRVVVDFFNNKGGGPVYDLLESSGVELYVFNPPRWGWRLNHRMHEKIMVVDGRVALLGGANLCDEYMLESSSRGLWQDYEILLEGAAAVRIQERFDQTWRAMVQTANRFRDRYAIVTGGSPPQSAIPPDPGLTAHDQAEQSTSPGSDYTDAGGADVLLHYQQPYCDDDDTAHSLQLYSTLFDSARSQIVLHTPYMSPPRDIKTALIEAAKRGVEVKIITNSPDTNDLVYLFSLAARTRYRRLVEAGVRIFESPDRTIHGKAIVVDAELAALGSHNFTHRSFFSNNEIKVIMNDPGAVGRLSAVFDGNIERFREVTRDDLENKEPGGALWLLGRMAGYFF